MSKTRAFVLNVMFPLVLVAIIFLFVRMSIAGREIGSLEKQIAELREAASSTYEQTIRRFDEFDRRLGALASFSKKTAPSATAVKPELASRAAGPKMRSTVHLVARVSRPRDERKEQEIKLRRDLVEFSYLEAKVCAKHTGSKAGEEPSKRCEDRTHQLAARGNSAAQEWLGTEARDKQQNQLAIFWLEQAANQGDLAAMNKLGAMYAGSEQQSSGSAPDELVDSTKAMYWYGKSASFGDVSAMGAIAHIYQEGRLVAQNQGEAILWYEFASKASSNSAALHKGQGSPNFAGLLGDIYYKGTGASAGGTAAGEEKVQAYEWYAIACADATRWNATGDQSCKSRSRTAGELTPIEVAKAQALAVEWEKLYRPMPRR